MAPGVVPRTTVTELVKAGENRDGHISWSEVPEVHENLAYMDKNRQIVQIYELKFEIIALEAAFNMRLRSLLGSPLIARSVTDADRKILFSSAEKVLKASDDFLADLEQCWRRDVFLAGVFDVVKKHEGNFDAHVRHCANQKNVILHLHKLKKENFEFVEDLETWQASPDNASKLDVESILDLPIGRLTSIVMISESVLNLMDKHDGEYKSCQAAIKATRKVATKCDQAAEIFGRRNTLLNLIGQLTFAEGVPAIPIAATSRELVKNGEVTLLTLNGGTLSRRSPRNMILFNDLILITKKSSSKDEKYTILDYCYLNNVELKSAEDLLNVMHSASLAEAQDKLLLIKMKKNFENKSVILLFSCDLEATRDDWTRLLDRNITNNLPQTELQEVAPASIAPPKTPELPHVLNRTTDQMRIIEELKIKQESRKKDFLVAENVVAEFNDTIEEPPVVRSPNEPFLIPRPVSRHISLRNEEPPPVLMKPTRPTTHLVAARPQPSKASVDATVTFGSLLDYPPGIAVFPLVTGTRWMVKSGEVVQRWHLEEDKYIDKKIPIHVTLFNDVLFLTSKKKGDSRHTVRSYGMRNLVDVMAVKKLPHIPSKLTIDRTKKFPFMIHILENQMRRPEMLVVCVSNAEERDSWMKAVPPYSIPLAGAKLVGDHTYDPWDRPLVVATQVHVPGSKYELPLAIHDKLHINAQSPDGWCEGERVSDGRIGVFPASCTVEMDSPHKHARELRLNASRPN